MGRLVVNQEAKAVGDIVTIKTLGACIFWNRIAHQHISHLRMNSKNEVFYVIIKSGFSSSKVAFSAGVLGDNIAQEKQFIFVIEGSIKGLKRSSTHPEKNQRAIKGLVSTLKYLTDLQFNHQDEWFSWWEQNKGSLFLSEDRSRVISKLLN